MRRWRIYDRHGSISAATTAASVPADASPLADFTYSYDADGKRLGQSEQTGSTSESTSYGYDGVGRLVQVVLPDGTCRDYGYDADSNRSLVGESSTEALLA